MGVIKWDFPRRTMEFLLDGETVLLRAETNEGARWSDGKLTSLSNVVGLWVLQHEGRQQAKKWEIGQLNGPPEINSNISRFSEVFEEPKTLPPHRRHNHNIALEEGLKGLSLRPYRYSVVQKDGIEGLVDEMLQSGIIQHSTSPFSAPVVLFKKKDETWRMCVDYRELNLRTINDKFPIPVIEELLDKLGGASWFSKLDLRSGYHQIWVSPKDVSKQPLGHMRATTNS